MRKNLFFIVALVAANSLMTYAQTGNVGIGTDVPSSKLTVNGNYSVGSGYTNITAPANGAIIEGNVGIGTSVPLTKLDVNGQAKISDGSIAPATSPATGSLVELESSSKGLRMPQIVLTSTTSWSPLQGLGTTVSSRGMSVYNTNAAITSSNINYPANGVGEYYWDGTGWVNKANNGAQNAEVLFSVKRTTTQDALDGNLWTICDFTSKDYDKNTNFNITSDTFTVPAKGTGFYQINAYIVSSSQAIGQGAYIGLFVNNTFVRNITVGNAAPGAGIAASGTIAVPLQAGNQVTIRYRSNTDGQTFIPQVDIYQLSR